MGQNSEDRKNGIWKHIAKKFAIIARNGVRHTVSVDKWKEWKKDGWERVN